MVYGSRWKVYVEALGFTAVLGSVFGAAAGAVVLTPPFTGALFGMVSGVVDAFGLTALIAGAEVFLPRTRFAFALSRRPFLAVVLVKVVAYFAVVVAVIGGRLGPSVALLLAGPERAPQFAAQIDAAFPRGLMIVISSMIVVLLVMLRHASQLVGEGSFRNILRGRYHRPRAEERFFLFVDVVGSTPVAERLGPLAVHRYLDRIFQIASDPVDDHGGDVFQYVGDELVVTWPLDAGRKEARPLACFFAIEAALAAAAPEFEREFGSVPRLRAALHAGEVVTGEIGGSRRAIVFHGDVMNTTSRIENATRDLGRPFLVSEEALKRLDGAERYALEDLGPQRLRGREAPMRVYAAARP